MSAAPHADSLDEMAGIVRDSASSLLRHAGGVKRARELRFSDPAYDEAVWAQMAQLGWIGLRAPEQSGGTGFDMASHCALAEELGRVIAPEPLIESALSATLLASCAAGRRRLPDVTSGRRIVLTAWQEGPDGLDAPGTPSADRHFVAHGFGAHAFLVPVRTADGLSLIEVDSRDVEFIQSATQDGGNVCTLRPAPAWRGETLCPDISTALNGALRDACLATSAYLLGLSEAAFDMTLDYLKIRQQFGQPIGKFQALRHRAADMKMQVELLRAAIGSAAAAIDSQAPADEIRRAVSRAKARACEASALVTREAIQMHGAIGYTDEHDIGLYFRKAMTIAPRYGTTLWHRRAYAHASDWGRKAA